MKPYNFNYLLLCFHILSSTTVINNLSEKRHQHTNHQQTTNKNESIQDRKMKHGKSHNPSYFYPRKLRKSNNSIGLLLVIGFLVLSPVPAVELCDLAQALRHLTLCSKMVYFADTVYLRHHDVHQPAALRHVRNPLHLRMYSFPHLST